MKVTPVKTSPVTSGGPTLLELIDHHVSSLPDHSILAVSSKIVSICEGRVVKNDGKDKQTLVRQEADYYRSPDSNPYNFAITIKADVLVGSAGIDESNGNGDFILWPKDPQFSANSLREHLTTKHGHTVGVIITDSHSLPMRRGATGFGLAHSGFQALVVYAGQPDIFGREFKSEVANILDGLSAAAVAVQGEGAEQTPLAVIEDVDFVTFHDRNPTPDELARLKVTLAEDVYREAFEQMHWDKRPE
jgi:F420-0:gamma-glutamyl ligase